MDKPVFITYDIGGFGEFSVGRIEQLLEEFIDSDQSQSFKYFLVSVYDVSGSTAYRVELQMRAFLYSIYGKDIKLDKDGALTLLDYIQNNLIEEREPNRDKVQLTYEDMEFISNNSRHDSALYLISKYHLTAKRALYLIDTFNKKGKIVQVESSVKRAYNNVSDDITKDIEYDGVTWREMLRDVNVISDLNKKYGDFYSENYTYEINHDNPIIVFTSDWHLGSRYTDYRELMKHWEFLLQDNVYTIVVGDLVDMFLEFKNKSVIHSQIVNPTFQIKLLKSYLEEAFATGRFIAVGLSEQMSHDQAMKVLGGIDIYSILFEKYAKNVAFMRNKGHIYLKVLDQQYEIAIGHKVSASKLNPFLGALNLCRYFYPNADVLVTAHTHNPASAEVYYAGKKRALINLGAFKIGDDFSVSYFDPVNKPIMKAVVLSGKEKEVRVFGDTTEASIYVHALSNGKPNA